MYIQYQSANTDSTELYVDPESNAARQVREWRETRPHDARLMHVLASVPGARWFGESASYDEIHGYVKAAERKQKIPVMVVYGIPNRDCGLYSAGGADDDAHYKGFIDVFARAVGTSRAIIILEPDALAQTAGDEAAGCLSAEAQEQRYELLRYAVRTLGSLEAAKVYIDGGNAGWVRNTDEIAALLRRVDVGAADGFSLNVSNFIPTDESIRYGERISTALGGVHFVIDTSRNGLGSYINPVYPDHNWCNPPGRAIGEYPTTDTGYERVDAFLHIKSIGESDGSDPDQAKCFGGPPAGTWWPEYALGLVERWPGRLQDRSAKD